MEDYVEAYNKSHEIGYQHFQQIIAKGVQGDIERWIAKYGKSYAVNYAQQAEYSVKEMEKHKKQAEAVKDHYRRRKANDYKNMDIILKWQDEHWMAKATWKRIKRHLPFPIDENYGNAPYIDTDLMANNPLSIFYHRNQKLTVQEFFSEDGILSGILNGAGVLII